MNFRTPYSAALCARKVSPRKPETDGSVMNIRTRKLLGAIALLLLALTWSLMGMAVAQMPALAGSGFLQAIFYVVAGTGWVLPAMPIVSWMSRPDVRPRSAVSGPSSASPNG